MHSVIKSSFYITFLVLALVIGVKMLMNSKGNILVKLFALIVLFLGIGEGFHILPRIMEIFTNDIGTYGPMMKTGRFISSISIIFVYLLLFDFWRFYYRVSKVESIKKMLTILAVIGVILSVVLKDNTGTWYILLRNIPIMLIGFIIIPLYKKHSASASIKGFKFLWLALLLSLVFTISFELLSSNFEFFIILMMPKILMYIWIVVMGYKAFKQDLMKIS